MVEARQRPPYEEGKAFGVEGRVGEEVQPLLLHRTAPPAGDPPDLHVQVDDAIAAGQVAHAAGLAIVPSVVQQPAGAAATFLECRVSVMTRACGSPKILVTVGLGEQPGKRYESQRRRFRWRVGMRSSCAHLSRPQGSISTAPHLVSTQKPHKFTHSIGRRLFLLNLVRQRHIADPNRWTTPTSLVRLREQSIDTMLTYGVQEWYRKPVVHAFSEVPLGEAVLAASSPAWVYVCTNLDARCVVLSRQGTVRRRFDLSLPRYQLAAGDESVVLYRLTLKGTHRRGR